RSIDGCLAVFLLAAPIRYFLPEDWDHNLVNASIQFLAYLIWIPIEAFLLSIYGYTPGKALLRVKARNKDGSYLNYDVALARSFSWWLKGMGAVLFPLITLITYYRSYRKLSDRGVTDWDNDEGVLVSHRIVGPERILIAILVHIIFVVLAFYRAISSALEQRGFQY